MHQPVRVYQYALYIVKYSISFTAQPRFGTGKDKLASLPRVHAGNQVAAESYADTHHWLQIVIHIFYTVLSSMELAVIALLSEWLWGNKHLRSSLLLPLTLAANSLSYSSCCSGAQESGLSLGILMGEGHFKHINLITPSIYNTQVGGCKVCTCVY